MSTSGVTLRGKYFDISALKVMNEVMIISAHLQILVGCFPYLG